MDAEKLSIDVEADTADAERALTGFMLKTEAMAAAMNGFRSEIKVDLDSSGLRPKLTAVTKAAGAGQSVKVPVEMSGLDALQGKVRNFGDSILSSGARLRDFRSALTLLKIPLYISLFNALSGAIGGVGTAAIAATSTLGPLTGLLATLPGLLGGLLVGVGGLAGAFKPVTGALKAYTQQESQAAKASATGARATESAAKARAAAAKEVERATRDLARAQRDAADDVEDAADNVQRAEDNLRDAQERAREAQDGLTAARERAAETAYKLGRSVEQAVLSERRARLRLSEAQAKNNKDSARAALIQRALKGGRPEESIGDLYLATQDLGQAQRDSARAALDLEQAELDLVEATDNRLELENRLQEVQRKGIEGSDEVVAANREVRDSQRAMVDSTKAVQESYEDFQKTQERSSERVEDANQRIIDSMERLTEATEEAGKAGGTAFKPFDDAMSKLTPLGREMVQVLLSFKGPLKLMREAIEQASFPQIISGLTNIRNFLPTLTPVVAGAARELGSFFQKWTELVTSPAFSRDLVGFGESNNRVLKDLGVGTLGLTQAFMTLVKAAQPVTEWLGRLFAGFGQNLAATLQAKEANGDLARAFVTIREMTALWGSILKNTFGILYDVFRAAFPLGKDLMGIFDGLLERTRAWTSSVEGQTKMKETFEAFKPLILELGGLFLDLAKALGGISFANIGPTTDIVKNMREGMIPAFKEFMLSLKDMGPSVTGAITSFFEMLANLPVSSIKVFFETMTLGFKAISALASLPVIGELIAALLTLAGLRMAGSAMLLILKPVLSSLGMVLRILVIPALTAVKGHLGISVVALLGWIAVIAGIVILVIKHWDTIKSVFGTAIRWIGEQLGKVPEFFGTMIGAIGRFGVRLFNIGVDFMGRLFNGLQSAAGKVWNFFTGIPGRIGSMLGNAKNFLVNIGKDIVEGLANGLKTGWDFVKRAWNWIIDKIPGNLANFLKISSPSRVMAWYGEMISRGLAQGIAAGGRDVTKSVHGIYGNIMREQANMALKVGGNFSTTTALTATTTSSAANSNAVLAASIEHLAHAIASARTIEATFNDTVDSRKVARDLAWKL